jgi:hypothetical protein
MSARNGPSETTKPAIPATRAETASPPRIVLPSVLFAALLALTLALAAAFLLVPNAQARLAFPPPQDLSEGALPQVAVDPQDRATVVWLHSGVRSVRLGADGTPGDVNTLLSNASDAFLGPQVALDAQGAATVVWERDEFPEFGVPISTYVEAVHVDAEGNPGEVTTLANFATPERDPDLGGPGDGPRVAVYSQGRATVVWRRNEHVGGSADQTVQAVRLSPDGTAGEVQTLSGSDAGDPKLAIDSRDRATVVWPRFDGTNRRIESVRLRADGTPGPVRTLSKPGQNADFPQVAVDRRGRATVVWRRTDRAKRRIQSVRVRAGGAPGKVKTLSGGADSPRVAVDPRGRATVVWRRIRQTKRAFVDRVQSVRLGADGSPGAVRTLSRAGAFDPQVAVDRRGRATVVWERPPPRGRAMNQIEARRLGASGAPEPVQTLSKADVGSPQVTVDSNGRPTVVWSGLGGLIQSTRGENR